jgi:hypothetical protein
MRFSRLISATVRTAAAPVKPGKSSQTIANGRHRKVGQDQPRDARQLARRFRQIARSSDCNSSGGSVAAVKDRVNALVLAPVDDFRRDSDLFGKDARKPECQRQAAFKRGFQIRESIWLDYRATWTTPLIRREPKADRWYSADDRCSPQT